MQNLGTSTKTEVARVRRGSLPNPRGKPGRDVGEAPGTRLGRRLHRICQHVMVSSSVKTLFKEL